MEEQAATPASAPKANGTRIPSIVVILAAILLCVSYFLPFTTAKEDSIATNSYVQSVEVSEGSDVTIGDLASPSVITWARFYKAYSERVASASSNSMNDYIVLFWIIVVSGALAVLALLFALLRKAIPTTLFALLNLGLNAFLCHYFEGYGPVSSGAASDWAPGHVVMLAAAAVLAAAGIWLFVAKHAEKKIAAVNA